MGILSIYFSHFLCVAAVTLYAKILIAVNECQCDDAMGRQHNRQHIYTQTLSLVHRQGVTDADLHQTKPTEKATLLAPHIIINNNNPIKQ